MTQIRTFPARATRSCTPSDPVSRRDALNSSSTNCANFTQLLVTVWAARNRKWRNVGTMATDKQTNRQTHPR